MNFRKIARAIYKVVNSTVKQYKAQKIVTIEAIINSTHSSRTKTRQQLLVRSSPVQTLSHVPGTPYPR
uniref:Uncharacterized protein n=1 Tax=Arundo donax TaxID=35708 RepID=A0A0A9DZJ6_ARUDO